jgi:ribosomal protein S18 acetylase RimI-like enzyme
MRSPVTIRRATPADATSVHALMTAARGPLYCANDLEFVRQHIADEGFTVVALAGEAMVGFCVVRFPGEAADNLGRDAHLTMHDLARVVHVESLAVAPDFRGSGLQQALITQCEAALDRSSVSWLLCTVAPANVPSLRNFAALGYRVVATVHKYGGHERYVLAKQLAD